MANKHIKRCSLSYANREKQDKTMKYHYTPIRMAKIQKTNNTKWWRGCPQRGLSYIAVRMQSCTATLEDSWAGFLFVCFSQNYSYHTIQKLYFLVFAQRNWKCMSTQKPAHGCLFTAIYNCQSLQATKVSLVDEWINTLRDIQTMDYHSALEGN